ncbi:MAG: hypothetical protein OXF55_01870 [Caldilineaceae bacterium]|nr:hypothetical protein [Caldilineaceae bacterium]
MSHPQFTRKVLHVPNRIDYAEISAQALEIEDLREERARAILERDRLLAELQKAQQGQEQLERRNARLKLEITVKVQENSELKQALDDSYRAAGELYSQYKKGEWDSEKLRKELEQIRKPM